MRAIFYSCEIFFSGQQVLLAEEKAKHLQVARVKINEDILLLNGKGGRAKGTIKEIQKKFISITILEVETGISYHNIDLAIATPKKEAFEDILKMAVELGVREIYPLHSAFSQYTYQESERMFRVLESALIQSNNFFLPHIHAQSELKDFLQQQKGELVFFNSRPGKCEKVEKINPQITILIGPEGGFSIEEEALILSFSNVNSIHLPTPILRAPTAVASSIGYLLARENFRTK